MDLAGLRVTVSVVFKGSKKKMTPLIQLASTQFKSQRSCMSITVNALLTVLA